MFANKYLLATFALYTVNAIPSPIAEERSATWTDPPFSVPTAVMDAAVTCPYNLQNKAGGIVFLVHGTGKYA